MTDIVEPSEKFTILLKLCELSHFQHQAHTLPLTTQLLKYLLNFLINHFFIYIYNNQQPHRRGR